MSQPSNTNPHQPTDHPDPPPTTHDAAAQPIDPWEQYFTDLDDALHHASTQERRTAVTNLLPMLVHFDRTRATEILVHLLDDHDTYVRLIAALDLAKAGDARGFTTLTQLFTQADKIERIEIVEALSRVTTSQSVHFLATVLQDPDPAVRSAAAQALGQLADQVHHASQIRRDLHDSLAPLRTMALTDLDVQAHADATRAMIHIDRATAQELIDHALHDTDSSIRANAVRALAEFRSAARDWCLTRLLTALQDETATVRLAAVHGLQPFSHEPQVIAALKPVCRRDQDPHVRAAAGLALGREKPRTLGIRPLLAVVVGGLLLVAFFGIGKLVYQPKSPLPADHTTLPDDRLVNTAAAEILLEYATGDLRDHPAIIDSLQLVPTDTFRIPCAQRFMDVVLSKLDCDVLVFSAAAPGDPSHVRFLVFREHRQVALAAIGITGWQAGAPDGDYVEFMLDHDEPDDVISALRDRAFSLAQSIKPGQWTEYLAVQKSVLIPFVSDPYHHRYVEEARTTNPVVQHLLASAGDYNPNLSLGDRVFSVRDAGAAGVYRPGLQIIQRPMFTQYPLVNTLAHELVHANLDGWSEKEDALAKLKDFLKATHPDMFDVTLPIFYEEELAQAGTAGDLLEVEEMLAFFAGTLATEDTSVSFFIRLQPIVTELDDIRTLEEPLLSTDVELLIKLGLIPESMSPQTVGFTESEITRRYYDLVHRYATAQ